MSEEIDIEEYNVLEDFALRDFFSDIDLLKEELRNYEQDIEVHGCSAIASGRTHQEVTQVESANCPRVIKVEHNSFSFDIEILEEDEVVIGDDDEPDSVDIENEIKVLQTTADKFEVFFKQQVDQEKSLNVNVVLDNLDEYLLSSGRFCSYCLTLFPTKNALDDHLYSRHPSYPKNKYKQLNKIQNKNCKHEPKTVFCNKKLKTYFNNSNLHSNIIKHQSQSHLQKQIFDYISSKKYSKNASSLSLPVGTKNLVSDKHKNLQKFIENKLCYTNFKHYSEKTMAKKNKNIPAFKKCAVVLNKLQIPSKSVKLTQGQLKIRKSTKKSNLKILNTEMREVRTCLKKVNPKDSEYRYRCHICSYYFATARLMYFHLANSHDITEKIPDECDVSIFDPNCKFCMRHFQDPLSYNKHLWKLHRKYVKNKNLAEQTPKPSSHLDARRKKKINNDCQTFISYGTEDELIQENSDLSSQVIVSNPSNLKESSMDLDIVHFESEEVNRKLEDLTNSEPNMIKSLAEDKTCEKLDGKQTNPNVYILKSAYFKCLKCDIYFLYSNIATNHKDHLEMLINWKCAICKLIFKKEDEIMHELQHAFTENFTIYGVLPADQIRILYNCQKCTVHFNGDHFLKHYPTCENTTLHSKYCRVCDILIDDFISKAHEQSHWNNKLFPDDFIIVESDVIPVLSANKTISKTPSSRFGDISSESLKVYYCKICNCYLHTQINSLIHIQGRCANLAKAYCQYCGFLFVSCCKTLQHHKQIHEKWFSLTLNHFDFYDIENKPITPPIPNYTECKGCNIHFFSENWYLHHKCGKVDFHICSLCETSYEKRTFELHMQFHNYSKIDVSIDSSNNSDCSNTNTKEQLSGHTKTSESNVVEPEQLSIANKSDTTTSNILKRRNTKGHSIKTNVMALSAKTSLKRKHGQKKCFGDPEVPRKRKRLKIEKPLVLPDKFDIYYCSACEACRHHLTTMTTKKHSRQLCANIKCMNCESCGLKFTRSCFELHKLMHKKVKGLDINCFTFYDHEGNPIAPPLPKYIECQKCHVHFFKEQSITIHVCGNTDYEKCGSCEIKYDNQTIKFHMSFHNYSKRDIQTGILFISKKTPIINGSVEMNNTKENKKCIAPKPAKRKFLSRCIKRLNFYTIYICDVCKEYFHSAATIKLKKHKQGICANFQPKNVYVCKICGIPFSIDSYKFHLVLHRTLEKEPNFNEITFYNAQHERVVPPMPEYNQCKKCGLIVISKHRVCETKGSIICNICEKIYEEETFKLHMLFHNYDKNKKRNGEHFRDPYDKIIKNHVTSPETVEQDQYLLKRKVNVHEEGIVYRCEACCHVLDTYDKVIEHCQEHILMIVPETLAQKIKCKKCNLDISIKYYARHQDLHINHQNENFFTVLNYDVFYFSTDMWIKHVLGTLPIKHREKILCESIYRQEHKVKMKILQNGPVDLTVYKCDRCCCMIAESELLKHANESCLKQNTITYPCSDCSFFFNSEIVRKEHEETHLRSNVKCESYKIVCFNRKKDKTLNDLLLYHNKYFIFYQCRICSVSADFAQPTNHECKQQNLLKPCPKCALFLSHKDYDKHILRHNEVETFSPKNIKVILFGKTKTSIYNHNFNGTVHDYKLVICSMCQSGFSRLHTLRRHCCDDPRDQCAVCKYYFGSMFIRKHKLLHDVDPLYTRKNIMVTLSHPQVNKRIIEHTDDEFASANDDYEIIMNQSQLNIINSNPSTGIQHQPESKKISDEYGII